MEPITVIIIDDEAFAIIDIKEELSIYPEVTILAEFHNGETGLEGINKLKPDLVFVDIEMPKLSGFEMLNQLTHFPIIIFSTGHSKYALEGYDYDPADFLLKPMKTKRFQAAMERAIQDIAKGDEEQRLHRQKEQHGYLLLEYRDLKGDAHKRFVWPEEIQMIRSQENNSNYIEYHLLDQSVHTLKKTIKKAITEVSPEVFFQVHQSYIINRKLILEFYKNKFIILDTPQKTEVPVSRAYRKVVKQYLQQNR